MSKHQILEATWSQFASLLGLPEHGFELDEDAQQQFFRRSEERRVGKEC